MGGALASHGEEKVQPIMDTSLAWRSVGARCYRTGIFSQLQDLSELDKSSAGFDEVHLTCVVEDAGRDFSHLGR